MRNKQIRDAIVAKIGQANVHVYPYPVDNINAPAAVITDLETEITTFDGGRTVGAVVTVLVSHNNPQQMALLDDLVDPNVEGSIPDLLDDVQQDDVELAVRTVGSFGMRMVAETPYYGAAITVEIID